MIILHIIGICSSTMVSVQGLSTGRKGLINWGCCWIGWQSYVAYINLGCYYLTGLPLGIAMGWIFDQGVMVVKVADFGVARVKAESGVMTAETGTYRWMAPEVVVATIAFGMGIDKSNVRELFIMAGHKVLICYCRLVRGRHIRVGLQKLVEMVTGGCVCFGGLV